MLKKTLAVATAMMVVSTAATAADAATYMPFGPQKDVALSDVTNGGWSLCYSASMGTPFGGSAASTLGKCGGNQLLLAGREAGSDKLLALAAAPKADALFDTGVGDNGVFHEANGSNWFYSDDWSWGFLGAKQTMQKYQCAFNPPDASMCIHTYDWVGGYSINQVTGLNYDDKYEKLVFTSDGAGAVPEPASWAMAIAGFGLIGGALRRRGARLAYAAA